MTPLLSAEQLAALQRHDTCSVANAIETFNVRMRNEGFASPGIRCLTPRPLPLVGYAATVRIRCADMPKDGHAHVERTDWWERFLTRPAPRIVVIQDLDEHPGTGSFVGETHAAILTALGCVGVITNGSVRDLPALQNGALHVFAQSLAVSRAYAHVVDMGGPVQIGGLTIHAGDLLHADMHGVLSVPQEIAADIPAAAQKLEEREHRIVSLCQSPDFSLPRLRDAVQGIFP